MLPTTQQKGVSACVQNTYFSLNAIPHIHLYNIPFPNSKSLPHSLSGIQGGHYVHNTPLQNQTSKHAAINAQSLLLLQVQ